ncbi:MAG: energy-coupling factor ABC transporter ATP-binding protein [Oscillospiraceae bacterium]
MIEINNLTVEYTGGIKALDGLSFSVADGESIALIGANGAGKSTLLLAIVGVVTAAGGTISADGITLSKHTLNEIRRRIGLVFQNPDDQLFMPLIRDDVAFGPRNYGLSEPEVAERVDHVLSELGILHLKDRSSMRLSGGEKRTAAIATVLAMAPSVIMLDEPTAFLDPKARRTLAAQLDTLTQTKIIATHDLDFAEKTCSRAIFIKKGKIIADGKAEVLLRDQALMEKCDI